MEEDFCDAQNSFCIQHCAKFEDNDENKLIYTELFEDYTNLLENLLDRKLREKIHVSNQQSVYCSESCDRSATSCYCYCFIFLLFCLRSVVISIPMSCLL